MSLPALGGPKAAMNRLPSAQRRVAGLEVGGIAAAKTHPAAQLTDRAMQLLHRQS
jgi:hypothetical protein